MYSRPYTIHTLVIELLFIMFIFFVLTAQAAAGETMGLNNHDVVTPAAHSTGGADITKAEQAAPAAGETWSSNFTLNGVGLGNDKVYALAVDAGGNVYVGGNFTFAGSVTVNGVARWNGQQWQALGSGLTNTDGSAGVAKALLVDAAGNLYVGGKFNQAGGIWSANIARWNGSAWEGMSLLAGTENAEVRALAMDPTGILYAGGTFSWNGSVNTCYVAKWNGSAWEQVGSGTGTGFYVNALTTDKAGNLYAGGQSASVLKWDGHAWTQLGGSLSHPQPQYSPTVYALAADQNNHIYIGGFFFQAGTTVVSNIAKWNGSAWEALGGGMYSLDRGVWALALDSLNRLYVGGNFIAAGGINGVTANGVALWNGSSWSALGSGMNVKLNDPRVAALAVPAGGDTVYAGGSFSKAGEAGANHVARWNGGRWSALGSGKGMDGSVQAMVVNTSQMQTDSPLYVGGYFSLAGDAPASGVARWDNNGRWSALGSGYFYHPWYSAVVSALEMDAAGHIYAAGMFSRAMDTPAINIAKWNGASWITVGGGISGTHSLQSGVNALAQKGSGPLYAGGWFDQAGNVNAKNIVAWDGSQWSALGSGIGGASEDEYYDSVKALAVGDNGHVYAGGNFATAGGVTAANIAKWNGANWEPLGSGMNGTVRALAFDSSGNLYAGGDFTTAGGVATNFLAMWNGSVWSPVGGGTNNPVHALVFDGGGALYVGGKFTTAGGVSALRVARWSDNVWSALDSGLGVTPPDEVNALAVLGDGLFAGGAFTSAGGKISTYIARWSANHAPAVSTFTKLGDKNAPLAFTMTDFPDHYLDADGDSLALVKITSLPTNGVLQLHTAVVTAGQEIPATDLSSLTFTPDAEWQGVTSLTWNGYDGQVYAAGEAAVQITITTFRRVYLPLVTR